MSIDGRWETQSRKPTKKQQQTCKMGDIDNVERIQQKKTICIKFDIPTRTHTASKKEFGGGGTMHRNIYT